MPRRISKNQIKDVANIYVPIGGPGIAVFANGMISTNLQAGQGISIGPNQRINGQLAATEQFALSIIFGG